MSDTVKESITKEDFEEATRRNRGRGFYDPSDESQFAMRREIKRPSPDSTQVAFVRDNNIWVSKIDGSDPWQLSFDGTDNDRYSRILWSPDGKKIAAIRKEVMKERQILLRESRPDDQVQPKYRWLDYVGTVAWQKNKKDFEKLILEMEDMAFEGLPLLEHNPSPTALNAYTAQIYEQAAKRWNDLEEALWIKHGRGF